MAEHIELANTSVASAETIRSIVKSSANFQALWSSLLQSNQGDEGEAAVGTLARAAAGLETAARLESVIS